MQTKNTYAHSNNPVEVHSSSSSTGYRLLCVAHLAAVDWLIKFYVASQSP